jgi:hypothetical protein
MKTLIAFFIILLTVAAVTAQSTGTELIQNGGFEIDANADLKPDSWNAKGGKRICGDACEYRFKGRLTGQKLVQKHVFSSPVAWSTNFTVSADSRAQNWDGKARVEVTFFHVDNTSSTWWLILPVDAEMTHGEFQIPLPKTSTKVKMKVAAKSLTGRLWVDNISLIMH